MRPRAPACHPHVYISRIFCVALWPSIPLAQLADGFCKMAKQAGHEGAEKELAEDTLRQVSCVKSAKNCNDYRTFKQAND